MVTLAIDTSARAGSVALLDRDGQVDARPGDPARTHGERLPQEALDVLATHQLSVHDVERFGVIAGPGSFTGLRVGLATVQGFALSTGRDVVPVPTLDALLEGWRGDSDPGGLVVTWLDGQRGDAFYAVWITEPGRAAEVLVESRVGEIADVVRDVRGVRQQRGQAPLTFVSPAPVRGEEAVRAAFSESRFEVWDRPLAAVAARWARDRADLAVAPFAVRPIYLRRPDAELVRARVTPPVAPVPPPSVRPLAVTRVNAGTDLTDVAALQQRSFTNPWGADAIQWELTHTDVARLYVARDDDGTLLGYAACWLLFDELHINSLAVDEHRRRQGIAARLLREVFRDAVSGGAKSATLEVRRSNEAARRLYEGLGFAVEAVRQDYYQLPREDALILWHRDLAGAVRLW